MNDFDEQEGAPTLEGISKYVHKLQQVIICNQSLLCRDGGQAISSAIKRLHEASVRMEKMLSDLTAAQQQQQDV